MKRATFFLAAAAAATDLCSIAHATPPERASGLPISDQVRAIVAEMLADAGTRSSLLQSGATAGHDGRFFLASPDGAFRLNIGGQLQSRYVLNVVREGSATGVDDDLASGFQARRNKLDFTGHVVSKDWTFRLLSAWTRAGGATLEEAWLQHNLGNGWTIRWGQLKLPLLREELVSSARQLAAERTLINEIFTGKFVQAVEAALEQADWRLTAVFSDGLRSDNTDLGNLALAGHQGFVVRGAADYALTGRFEYKLAGDWRRFADFTSRRGDDFAALIGGAAHFQDSPNTPRPSDVDRRTFVYTADVSLEGDGWNGFAALVGRRDDFRGDGAVLPDADDFGAVVQAGFMLTDQSEIFGRWDALFPDSDRGLDRDSYSFLTFGVNHYFAGHALKATADVLWALNPTDELAALGILPNTGIGLRGSDRANEITVRLQFQILF